jgi:5-methylcytosine-specific restriction endonuclease McrA
MSVVKNKHIKEAVYRKYNGRCAYCGVELDRDKFCIDHINPLKRKSGDYDPTAKNKVHNYNPSCYTCNSSKSDLSLEEFRERLQSRYSYIKKEYPILTVLERMNIVKFKNKPVKFWFEKV